MIQGKTGKWEIIIGLEVHAQVTTESKLFSGAATSFGSDPNTQVSLVDAALPGMLPVLNKKAVEQAVLTGLAINAKINRHSVFDRKNYFYPDLPQGYQISQFSDPIVGEGEIEILMEKEERRIIRITRIHLEQDAGKSVHDQSPVSSYVDLNRSGIPLMEIVSEPDMRSAAEAAAYVAKLRSILQYLGTCDGNMERGNLRCDANVSVRRPGDPLGTRCEIKNVNSLRFLQQAIDYEARRHVEVIESGGQIVQETRLFDSESGVTRSMRSKEEAHDYRYFPDPDLMPLDLDEELIESLRARLPELPDKKLQRFVQSLGLAADVAGELVGDKEKADYFEPAAEGRDAKLVANMVRKDVFGYANGNGLTISEVPVKPDQYGALIDLVAGGTINAAIASKVFNEMAETGKDAGTIVAERGLKQVSDEGELETILDTIIASSGQQVNQFKSGNEKIIGWFVGQVMQKTKGQANPKIVNELLIKKLTSD